MAGKQDHLLAGKKKLEEFRKKKAAEKAKKTTSNSQSHPAVQQEKQSAESVPVRVTVSDGAGTSYGAVEPSGKIVDSDNRIQIGSLVDEDTGTTFSANNYNVYSVDPFQTSAKDEEVRHAPIEQVAVQTSTSDKGTLTNHAISSGTSERLADGIVADHITSSFAPSVQDSGSSSKRGNYGLELSYSNDSDTRLKDTANFDTSLVSEGYKSSVLQKSTYNELRASDQKSYSFMTNGAHGYNQISGIDERKFSSSVGQLTSASNPFNSKESLYSSSNYDGRSSSNQELVDLSIIGTNTRRSRPSFLDFINTSRIYSPPVPKIEPQNVESSNLDFHTANAQASSTSQDSINAFGSSNGHSLFRHDGSRNNFESTHSFYSTKQNEDFSALEQHIEDLTQEKFSLQRALEASRTLAESLASENSALTDSYNQQGSSVHQLKSDMENLQQEIQIHLAELESLKGECANAQLECSAADERAKLLASEVIGLEEKALRLRSSELKLERQLENSQAEISSLRKKITSIEKDRQDLQLTINALQEEKKLLQTKLWKASTTEKSADASKSQNLNKKNASTSTEDLVNNELDSTPDTSNHEMHSAGLLHHSDASSSDITQYSLEGFSLSALPPDQMRMIGSINTLISELAHEKEELVHALSAESIQSSKLKDLNKELSRKLEIQTQRLELLAAQSMANVSVPVRQPDSFIIPENTPYADEGDEVVERVLGWIMKLFPGGPSRRRTSKLN
ncbi:protein BLISTER isoform X2 [Apium graveolens]|uniref:protein BLISTER isoform X2 n=1 Tax=Apium graveolens TaxID=4045 RepID=UPI003D7B1413